jgi:hypothetical protein
MKSAAASAAWQAAPAAACHDDSTGESPVLMGSEPGSGFVLTRFLHANRYPLRSKTLWLLDHLDLI